MSDFKFACPHCAQRFRCDTRHAGRMIRCPKCQRPTIIPAPGLEALQRHIVETGNRGAPERALKRRDRAGEKM